MRSLVSIVMPARNEGPDLRRTIDSLRDNTFHPNWEAWILDDASSDGCADFLEQSPYRDDGRLHRVRGERQVGHVRMRQEGARRASGDILQFLDAHHRFTPYWLTNLHDALRRRGHRGIVGPVLTGLDGETWEQRWTLNWGWSIPPELDPSTQNRRSDLGPDCSVHWLGGCQMMLTRELYERLGGLCELFLGHGTDDTELSLRAWLFGESCHVEPTAVIGHRYKDHFVNPVTWSDIVANYLLLAYLTGGSEAVERLGPTRASGYGYREGQERFESLRAAADSWRARIRRHQERELAALWHEPRAARAVARPGPEFSLIIAAHDEGENLRRTVDSIRAGGDELAFEVVLVDDGSTDGGFDHLEERLAGGAEVPLEVVRLPERRGCNVARDRGAEVARGEHLVFLDAHMALPEGWLSVLRAASERYGRQALLSPDITSLDPATWSIRPSTRKVIALDDALDFRWDGLHHFGGLLETVVGCCICMRAELYREVNGFDRGLRAWGSEFVDLVAKVYRAGGFVAHLPELVVGHLFRRAFPYSMRHEDIVYNKLRVGFLHLPAASFERLHERLARAPGFIPARERFRDDLAELELLAERLPAARPRDWWPRTFRSELRTPACVQPNCSANPRWRARYCGDCGSPLVDGAAGSGEEVSAVLEPGL